MLPRRVRIQVLAFVLVALSAVTFVGANYAGLDNLFGSGYVVKLRLSEGGGVFTNGEVTYRGVAVGRVGELRLTDDGMEADLRIDDSAPPIPSNTEAVVANRSAIGEQYVDLQPRTEDGPYLADGAAIPMESTSLPLPVSTVLRNLNDLNASIPTNSLRTVVDELYNATQSSGANLQVLMDSSRSFTWEAADHLPQTSTLIEDGATVLRTQYDSSRAWRSFSEDAKLFASELASADGDLRKLIGTAPRAATQLSGLLKDTNPGLSILVANLLTTAHIFKARTGGMEQLFVTMPKAVAATSTAITPNRGNISMALTFFDPPPCTAGYGTRYRRGENTSRGEFNSAARCTLPASSGRNVRGSRNAPKGGVPPAAKPGSVQFAGPLGAPSLGSVSTSLEELLWLPK
ncbi:MAG: MCE family protein [Pseudonocardiaceae bacterium]|nr:MCE family protein [Pseudonocardiaceae bacterium]